MDNIFIISKKIAVKTRLISSFSDIVIKCVILKIIGLMKYLNVTSILFIVFEL